MPLVRPATTLWNAGVVIATATLHNPAFVALVAFGLDSVVEVTSAAAVAWQFSAREPETREKAALRVIAASFFALAAYVTVDAVLALAGGGEAGASLVGIVLAAMSLALMPGLSLAQRHAGRQLGSASAVSDSKQTLLCSYLSGVLLLGLALNATLGWAWADPAAALVIAAFAIKEGREAWRGDACCPSPITAAEPTFAREPDDDACECGSDGDACCAPAGEGERGNECCCPRPCRQRWAARRQSRCYGGFAPNSPRPESCPRRA